MPVRSADVADFRSMSSNWVTRALRQVTVSRRRSFRLATDCTGMATPELMWKLACTLKNNLPKAEVVWTCDISSASRAWIRKVLGADTLILKDLCARKFAKEAFTAEDIEGNSVNISREQAHLDIYIVGFMCSPFSSAGEREGWSADATATFFNSVRTIVVMQPTFVILENVLAVANSKNVGSLMQALSSAISYRWKFIKVHASEFGVPQDRDRYYIIGQNVCRGSSEVAEKDLNELQMHIDAMKSPRDSVIAWPQFLADAGLPLAPLPQGLGVPLEPCSICDRKKPGVCTMHPCTCNKCALYGTKAHKCIWRAHLAKWQPKNKNDAHKYLATWRHVKKDNTLKVAPTYYTIGASKQVQVPQVIQDSPRVRSCLVAWSSVKNLYKANAICNTSQAIDRSRPRFDGLVPTLTTTCGRLFAFKHGCFLSGAQCLALQGFDPSTIPHEDFSENMLCTLAGMGMTAPVIGSIMVAVVGKLQQ